jgi:hypothetical protein
LRRHPLVALLLSLLVLGSSQAPWVASAAPNSFDSRFGAVEAFRANDHADQAGVRWTRLVFWWSGLQPNGPQSWNSFYFPDDLLQAELGRGRQVVGLLINTPPWAGSGSPNDVPKGLERPIGDSQNHWAEFAREMAERYKGRIDHWVIWNEPDIWDHSSPLHTWNGSVEEFYRLQKVGYQAIKQANPRAQVGLPGLTYWWDQAYGREQYFERYLRVAERDPDSRSHNWFFDAAVLHLYNEPEQLFSVPELYRRLMAARAIRKPIWVNETNVPTWDDPASPMPHDTVRVTQDQQAAYLIQAFAYGLAAGVERISLYPFSEANAGPTDEPMGLVRRDGTTRPAYDALRVVTRHLQRVRGGQVDREGDAIKVTLERDGGSVIVAWSVAPRPVVLAIPATRGGALLVDKLGVETAANATAGVYRIKLAPAPATQNDPAGPRRIGGDPLLLLDP